MVYHLKPKKCEHCEKDYLLKCHCQTTPEELEANRIHTKNMIDRYMEARAEFQRNNPGVPYDAIC